MPTNAAADATLATEKAAIVARRATGADLLTPEDEKRLLVTHGD